MSIKIVFLITSCQRTGPINQTLNIIKHLDREIFEPVLITLYKERAKESMLEEYLPYISQHYFVPLNKIQIMCGYVKPLQSILSDLQPQVIHSVGVFPAYALARVGKYPHLMTLRCDIWEDYIPRFGRIRGTILVKLHQYAMKRGRVVTCSESLARIYQEKTGCKYDFIRNGVDLSKFGNDFLLDKQKMRARLSLPQNSFLFVYAARMHSRKNQDFLLHTFCDYFQNEDIVLLLLGNGSDYERLRREFGTQSNILFKGQVSNVSAYLQVCDAYVSTSRAEGMPNGVLEAMASGLSVVLSDIPQHMEILNLNANIGFSYKQGDSKDLADKMHRIAEGDYIGMGERACRFAHKEFSARRMSERYQTIYREMARKIE